MIRDLHARAVARVREGPEPAARQPAPREGPEAQRVELPPAPLLADHAELRGELEPGPAAGSSAPRPRPRRVRPAGAAAAGRRLGEHRRHQIRRAHAAEAEVAGEELACPMRGSKSARSSRSTNTWYAAAPRLSASADPVPAPQQVHHLAFGRTEARIPEEAQREVDQRARALRAHVALQLGHAAQLDAAARRRLGEQRLERAPRARPSATATRWGRRPAARDRRPPRRRRRRRRAALAPGAAPPAGGRATRSRGRVPGPAAGSSAARARASHPATCMPAAPARVAVTRPRSTGSWCSASACADVGGAARARQLEERRRARARLGAHPAQREGRPAVAEQRVHERTVARLLHGHDARLVAAHGDLLAPLGERPPGAAVVVARRRSSARCSRRRDPRRRRPRGSTPTRRWA